MSPKAPFPAPISEHVWQQKYRFRPRPARHGSEHLTFNQRATSPAAPDGDSSAPRETVPKADRTLDDTFKRVAKAAAAVEKGGKKVRAKWAEKFHAALADFGFIPAGRILAGAGTKRDVTLFNCFVQGTIADDLGDIFDHVREAALTMQQGGGIGYDFSTLRPKGAEVKSIGADASGPVSFMDVWDAMCKTIMSAGARRGAMMGTLRVDHPDIESFIAAKADAQRLRNFNLSVLITDAFMEAVANDAGWDLKFDDTVYRTVKARDLWHKIMRATYDYAEPGVVFIDRINAQNNLNYCETITATNPCGEQPLPPYGACLLGSINLMAFLRDPFTDDVAFDKKAMKKRVAIAVRLLDNMIDASNMPLKDHFYEAKAKRRIGLGVTGLADALMAEGLRYGTPEAQKRARTWMRQIQNAAYNASADLAKEKGTFPLYDADKMQERPNIKALKKKTRAHIAKHGLRNGCLTSIAPTGTISLLAGNLSSGIEPVFADQFERRVLKSDGTLTTMQVEDFAVALYRRATGRTNDLPPAFVAAEDVTPRGHLAMQAALQPYVDSSISKTINCTGGIAFADFENIYREAYELGLKGCTTYRPNPVTGHVLQRVPDPETGGQEPAQPVAHLKRQTGRPVSDPEAEPLPVFEHGGGVASRGDVVAITEPLERDNALHGTTYKLTWPQAAQALYVTINDVEVAGRLRPYEIFINTRHLEHYAWTVALTRMISAIFRRGGDVAFVARELQEIFDPQGGAWIKGRYVPSLLAAIGDLIQKHMVSIGFLAAPAGQTANPVDHESAARTGQRAVGHHCPRCNAADYVRQESCWVCLRCGFSRCD